MSTLYLPGHAPLLDETAYVRSWNASAIDLSDLDWVSPFDIAAIAALATRRHQSGFPLAVVLPSDPGVRAYLVDMGLPPFLPGEWGGGGASRTAPPWLPLTQFHSGDDWDEALRTLWPVARTALGTFELAERTIYILSELIDNATTHGTNPVGTFVCAQSYTGKTSAEQAGIQLGIADAGVGIPRHLRRNPLYKEERDDSQLIRLSRRQGVTGTADHRGFGLWEVFDKASELAPSRILIRSGQGEGRFWLYGDRSPAARYRYVRPAVPGTWIHVHVDAIR